MAWRFVLASFALQCQVAFCALGGRKWKRIFELPPAETRRLQTAGTSVEIEQEVTVTKADYFVEESKVYICYIGEQDDRERCLNLQGTDGMKSSLVHKVTNGQLHSGMTIKITGVEVTGTQLNEDRIAMAAPAGVAAAQTQGEPARADALANTIIIDVVSLDIPAVVGNNVAGQSIVGNSGGGTGAPGGTVKVLAVITTTCGESTGLDVADVKDKMFGTSGQSYKKRFEECSGSPAQVTVDGDAYGPVEVCPTAKRNSGETWAAVKPLLQAAGKYDTGTYYVLLVPDSWLDAIGMGQLGGKITWVRKSYYDKATMHLHEIGHNMYLHHAAKGSEEYGDPSSPMGYCCDLRCYHSIHSWQLGFSTVAKEINVADVGSEIVSIQIKEHAKNKDSVVVIKRSSSEYYALSYRGDSGFDSFLSSDYQNQVFVHKYSSMGSQYSAELTYLEDSAMLGLGTGLPIDFGGGQHYKQNAKIGSTGLQLTWWSITEESYANGKVAHVRICAGDGKNACGEGDGGVTQAPTLPPEMPLWTSYFTESQGSSVTNKAMMGVGCKGAYCSEIKTAHSQLILIDLDNKVSIPSTGDVSEMLCGSQAVTSRILCTGANCKSMTIECAPVRGGTLDTTVSGSSTTAWTPAALGQTEENTCPSGSVVTGVMCGGTDCAKIKLRCHKFNLDATCDTADSCVPLGLECGFNGCGQSCGTCANPQSCLDAAGRCATVGVQSDWFNSDTDMPNTGIVATGLKCKDRYCGSLAVVSMGVTVDLAATSQSGWISDNVGKKYVWNDAADQLAADCPAGTIVTHIQCRNKHCDDLKLTCAPPKGWTLDEVGEPWVGRDWFSEEEGFQDCPLGFGMTGLECQESKGFFDGSFCVLKCGDYCDFKKIRCRQLVPTAIGSANTGIANSAEIQAAQVPSTPCDESCRAQQMALTGMGVAGGAIGTSLSPFVGALAAVGWAASY